jgi:hypothetical protein
MNDKRRGRDFGMDRPISRRDFLDGVGFDAAIDEVHRAVRELPR